MMSLKKRPHLALGLILAAAIVGCIGAAGNKPGDLPPIEVYFSPKGGCQDAIVKEIGAAKESIHVQAYSFTSAPIAKALVDAHKRGVKVEAVIDKHAAGENYSEVNWSTEIPFAIR